MLNIDMTKRKFPIRSVTTFSTSNEDVNEVDLPNKEIRNSGAVCPTSISISTNHSNGNEEISKAKQGQRVRREKERAQSMLNSLIVPIPQTKVNGRKRKLQEKSQGIQPIIGSTNKRICSQRARRENEASKFKASTYTMDGISIPVSTPNEGNEPIVEIIYLRGSSSNGNYVHENEVIIPWPKQ
ncbi:hypothetical protein FRX31_009766 [Thalictrum thalictroides]|uniref:Uncharacterized protein n=1 Tax=Thalictrum thalictroides TaxID=46969 RepID=A0A7J6WUR9_THATH|nr:hypothetical protein FRX31_009766 [Thalictrum thalictroides]